MNGEPCIRDLRLTVRRVLEALAIYPDRAELKREYPELVEGMVIVTLDADFHALLALAGATAPSVIRIRIEGLRGAELAQLLINVLQVGNDDLLQGAMVSVTEHGVRIRRLPVV